MDDDDDKDDTDGEDSDDHEGQSEDSVATAGMELNSDEFEDETITDNDLGDQSDSTCIETESSSEEELSWSSKKYLKQVEAKETSTNIAPCGQQWITLEQAKRRILIGNVARKRNSVEQMVTSIQSIKEAF